MKFLTTEKTCAKCGTTSYKLQWCFGCKKYYCLDCVELSESDDTYSDYVKYYVYCPVDRKHHMNSTYLQGTNRDKK